MEQGAVSINGQRITDANVEIPLERDFVLKVGKRRFLKIVVQGGENLAG